MEALLVQELGSEVLATLGGVSSKLAAMKAKLQGRGSAARLARTQRRLRGGGRAPGGERRDRGLPAGASR